jgi:hypothetical protein
MKKVFSFIGEIGTIMYVGGILSHIVIGAVLGHENAQVAYNVSVYKEMSAYILILPGLALKIISDIALYKSFDVIPNWFKIKIAAMLFLTINAFVFLVPMMPELVALAKVSLDQGAVNQAFLDKAALEAVIGASNALPLLIELIMGAFRPKFGKERK